MSGSRKRLGSGPDLSPYVPILGQVLYWTGCILAGLILVLGVALALPQAQLLTLANIQRSSSL
jgi:hypothetical protein